MRARLVSAVLLVLLAACKESPKTAPEPSASGAASSALSAAPVASSSAAPAASGLAADATGTLAFAWKVANAAHEHVAVSIAVGDEAIPVGELDATSDEGPANVTACAMRRSGAKSSELVCGMTPAYNYYTAKLDGGALVVTLTTGIDGDPASEKVKEVLRRPTAATSMRATGPASKALFGNCRPGYVQRAEDAPCMRQCLKGNECKSGETCSFVTVRGTDGEHKVHACVAPGK